MDILHHLKLDVSSPFSPNPHLWISIQPSPAGDVANIDSQGRLQRHCLTYGVATRLGVQLSQDQKLLEINYPEGVHNAC